MKGDSPIFPDGLRVYAPNAKAPAWVKGTIVVTAKEFSQWAHDHADGNSQVRLTICESKGGKYYAKLDTFKPREQADEAAADAPANVVEQRAEEQQDGLPF